MTLTENTQSTAAFHNENEVTLTTENAPRCKHCGEEMVKMAVPREANFNTAFFWVCFNDDCAYFKEGWAWMMEKYNVNASYRHRIDPSNGQEGPLAVWSFDALKDRIFN